MAGRSHPGETDRAAPSPPSELRGTTLGLVLLITLIGFESLGSAAALPAAARDLHDLRAFGWLITAFMMGSIVGLAYSGAFCDAWGVRRSLLAGAASFTAGLVVAGTATTTIQLTLARFTQGVAAGLLMTSVYVVIATAYPASAQARALAAVTSGWVLPGLVGPLAAGVVAEQLSWRWVFVGLLPLVGSALLLLMPLIRHPPVHAGRPIRWPRLLPALGVAAGAALVETAGAAGSPFAAAAYVAAGVLVLVLSLRCLVPARTLALGPGAAAPVALRGLFAGVFFGVEMLLPLAMAVQHRQPPTEAAIPLACAGLPCAIGAWWHGSPQAAAVSTTRIVRAGFLLLALGVALTLAAVRPGSLGWMVYPGWAIAGLAAGAGENRINASLLRYSAAHARGANSAALQLSDAAGAAVTTGVGGVLVAAAGRGELSYTACFTAIFGAMGGLALLGALWAGRIRPGEPGS